MKIVIFLGPTMPVADARGVLDADYRPPVGQGDFYRAVEEGPAAIGIIDGVFEQMPAVWHKEILWGLAKGIHVFGSASMGALRAAELAPFGMEGVGTIYQAFRSGQMQDDDEVAVAHGDAAAGFRPVSEAMVNIRATLQAAAAAGVLDQATLAHLIDTAKALYYPDRNFPALIAEAERRGVSPSVRRRLEDFLRSGRVNQKRDDGLQMLRVMATRAPSFATKRPAGFVFEHTDTWDQVVATTEASRPSASGQPGPDHDSAAIVEELRLRGPLFSVAQRGGLLRALAEREANRQGMAVTPALRDATQDAFRRERGLEETKATWKWIETNELDEAAFGRLLESEARLRWLTALFGGDGGRQLRTELVAMGEYPALLARARHKQEVLAAKGLADPALSDASLTEEALLAWYFDDRLGRPLPISLPAYLHEVGLGSKEDLLREALREFLYLSATKPKR